MKLRNLDLNLLIIFEAIYAARNISHAAKKLGVSQPTISNALARLRDSLDDKLFIRAGRGVEPTQKAFRIIGPVRDVLQTVKTDIIAGDEFDPTATHWTFRMVLLDQLEPILMPSVLRQIQDYKSITLETHPLSSTSVTDRLNDGTLDLALSIYVNNLEEYECEVIGHVNAMMIARKNHPKIKEVFTRENFEEISHVALVPHMRALFRVDEALQRHKITRHIAYAVTKYWSFPYIVANTDLVALFPGDFARSVAQHHALELYSVPFEMPDQQVYMTWKKDRTHKPGHQWLRRQIRQAYKDSLRASHENMVSEFPGSSLAHA